MGLRPVFPKLDKEKLRKLKINKLPTLDYSWRRRGADTSHLKSLETAASCTTTNNIMDPANLQKETPEVREQILAKARRISVPYNKGAYQYVPDYEVPTRK